MFLHLYISLHCFLNVQLVHRNLRIQKNSAFYNKLKFMFAGVLEAAKLYCQSDKGGVSNDIGINVGATMGAKLSVL